MSGSLSLLTVTVTEDPYGEALYQMFYIIILFISSKQHRGRQDCPPFVSEDSEPQRG